MNYELFEIERVDMENQEFVKLLQDYGDALGDRKRFAALLKDYFPNQPLQVNLILYLLDMNICAEIEESQQINNSFIHRFTKRLCDEHGVSNRNADWAVNAWCMAYGETIIGKALIKTSEKYSSVDNEAEENETLATTFDIDTNNYVDDWRNVYEYKIDNGGVIINRYIAFEEEKVVIPDEIEGYPVVEIGQKAFQGCSAISHIIFPKNLKRIGASAFERCGLSKIALPSGLRDLDIRTFYDCKADTIFLSDLIETIPQYAFAFCSKLRRVVFSSNLKTIEHSAFMYCSSIKCIDLPVNVEKILESCFALPLLKRIRMPKKLTNINKHAFSYPEYTPSGKLKWYDLAPNKSQVTIYCHAGSEALRFAREIGFAVDKYENYYEEY